MNEQPLISVIIPIYNATESIIRTLDSVTGQTYQNIEIILVNDGSTSQYTIALLEELVKGLKENPLPSNCFIYHKENGGVSSARNYGIEKANGKYIAMLDSDDFWGPNILSDWVTALEHNPFAVLAYSGICFVNEDATTIYGYSFPGYSGFVTKQLIEVGNFVANGSNSLIRKSALDKLDKLFDISLCYAEEWDLFLRLSEEGSFEYIDKPQCFYRVYSSSASSRFDKLKGESTIVASRAIIRNKNIKIDVNLVQANVYLSVSSIMLSRCSAKDQILPVLKFQLLTLVNKPLYLFNKEWLSNSVKWILFMLVSPKRAKEWKNQVRKK